LIDSDEISFEFSGFLGSVRGWARILSLNLRSQGLRERTDGIKDNTKVLELIFREYAYLSRAVGSFGEGCEVNRRSLGAQVLLDSGVMMRDRATKRGCSEFVNTIETRSFLHQKLNHIKVSLLRSYKVNQ
jgi:hypothetical protein